MTMTANNFQSYKYTVNGQAGFNLSTALQLWKTKYVEDFRDFEKEVITHEGLHSFRDFVKEMWDSIQEVTIEDALRQESTEVRRTYFDSLGVQKIFKQMEPTLLDKQIIEKKRTRWDDKNIQYEYAFKDVYELYKISGEKMFGKDRWGGNSARSVYAVRCWCTTTNREYWLYVPQEAATGNRWSNESEVYDAIRAIAWTIRIDVTNPERIYRQGDIIVVKKGKDSEDARSYHLTKDQYLSLMYSES